MPCRVGVGITPDVQVGHEKWRTRILESSAINYNQMVRMDYVSTLQPQFPGT